MILVTITVNETVKLYFQTTTGITDFSTITVLNNGTAVTSPSISVVETSVEGTYCATYTPSATGKGLIIFNGLVIAHTDVVTKSIYSYLKNIEDESMGSWTWDKQLGRLHMLRQDGTSLAWFDVVENTMTASRERT